MLTYLDKTDRMIRQGLAKNRILPIMMPPRVCKNPMNLLIDAGVMFGKTIPLFHTVHLPTGWTIAPTEISIWWELLDRKVRRRAAILYRCSEDPCDFYAELEIRTRYHYCPDYERQKWENLATTVVYDCGKIIHTTESIQLPPRQNVTYQSQNWYQSAHQASTAAEAWLRANFPRWRDPSAYWD